MFAISIMKVTSLVAHGSHVLWELSSVVLGHVLWIVFEQGQVHSIVFFLNPGESRRLRYTLMDPVSIRSWAEVLLGISLEFCFFARDQ